MPLLSTLIDTRISELAGLDSVTFPFDPVTHFESPAMACAMRIARLDRAVHRLLDKDGKGGLGTIKSAHRIEEKRYWAAKAKEHELAKGMFVGNQYKPLKLSDLIGNQTPAIKILKPLYGNTGLKDHIIIRYNTLCAALSNQKPVGGWALVLADLVNDPLTEEELIVDLVPNLVPEHPSDGFLFAFPTEGLQRTAALLNDTSQKLAERHATMQASVVLVGKAAVQAVARLAAIVLAVKEAYDIAAAEWARIREQIKQEAARRQEQERVIHEINERTAEGRGHELRGARDHVDAFERNGDVISRTC